MIENENLEINENDTYVNQDVEAIQAMQARFDAELAKRDAKYSALLKFATEGGKISAETPQEPTPAEQKAELDSLARSFRNKELCSLDMAKALIKMDDYVTSKGGRTIFTYSDPSGTPTVTELESAGKVRSLLEFAIEKSDNSDEMFRAAIVNKLSDPR